MVLVRVCNSNTSSNYQLSAEEILLPIYLTEMVQEINYSVHRFNILKQPYTKKKPRVNYYENLKVNLH